MTKFSEIYEATTSPVSKEEFKVMYNRLEEVSKNKYWKEFLETLNRRGYEYNSHGVYMSSDFENISLAPDGISIYINPTNIKGSGTSKEIKFKGKVPREFSELKKILLKNKIDKFVIDMVGQRHKEAKAQANFYKDWKNPD